MNHLNAVSKIISTIECSVYNNNDLNSSLGLIKRYFVFYYYYWAPQLSQQVYQNRAQSLKVLNPEDEVENAIETIWKEWAIVSKTL